MPWGVIHKASLFSSLLLFVRLVFRLLFAIVLLLIGPSPVWADDPSQAANRTFTEAIQNIRRAGETYDMRESVKLLRAADRLLKKIVSDYPESTIAVQLVTNQFIGDFDVLDFRNRIRALSCERGNYVEDFLSEYGIVSATGPNTEACFLYRLETHLDPFENPPQSARWDWLSLSVSYYLHTQSERSRQILLPFLNTVSARARAGEGQDMMLLVARALMLTGQGEQAQNLLSRVGDCTARLTGMAEMVRLALWNGQDGEAHDRADNMASFAEENQCNWQKPLVAQMLMVTGRKAEAQKMYDTLHADQYTNVRSEDRTENTPPDLAIIAAMLDEPEEALAMLRVVMDANPWAVPQVLTALSVRDKHEEVDNFLTELKSVSLKAQTLAALVDVRVREKDKKRATQYMGTLAGLKTTPSVPQEQVEVLAARARGEKALYHDDRWRETIATAVNTSDLVEEGKRQQAAEPILAALAFIKTGFPQLD